MVHLEEKGEWFATWFDSPYYHVLYLNRNDEEAQEFIERLMVHLNLPKSSKLLDLACGAGRHARVLHKLGYKVTGVDLSPNSIEEANKQATDGMDFFVHDMRDTLPTKFDAIFNLFTSFGYFETLEDNLKVLNSVFNALPSHGILTIDFMNAEKIVRELKSRQELERDGIQFNIKKEVINGRIIKTIAFQAEEKSYFFQEKVQALYLSDFEALLEKAGFILEERFGNYALEGYDAYHSDRLILICRKP